MVALAPTKVPIGLHPRQMEFVHSRHRFTGYVGGRGSGKTRAGAYKLFRQAKSGRFYLMAAPTYSMLHDSTVRVFEEIGAELGWIKSINRSRGNGSARIYTMDGGEAEIIFRSSSEPDRFRGPNLSGIWLDEGSYADVEAFDISIACLRQGGESGWFAVTFTPNGKRHWTYRLFTGDDIKDKLLVHSPTSDNPWLPDDYEATLRSRYTSSIAQQELDGQFVDNVGSLLSYEKIISCMDDLCGKNLGPIRGPLYLGADIGVTQNLSVVWTWELIGDVLWCRECLEMKGVPLEEQAMQIGSRVLNPAVVSLAIDAGGPAAQMVQGLKGKYSKKIVDVHFGQSQMGAMSMALANSIELKKVRIPSGESILRDFLLVDTPEKRNGNWVLAADQVHTNEHKEHADRFWAAALGLFAFARDDEQRGGRRRIRPPTGRRL